MKKVPSKNMPFVHDIRLVLSIGFFLGLILTAVIIFTLPDLDNISTKMQGYLLKTVPKTEGDPSLLYEHMYVVDPTGAQNITMSFYANDMGNKEVNGVDLTFGDFPDYLHYVSHTFNSRLGSPSSFISDYTTEFDKSNPHFSMYNNAFITDGHLFDITFSVSSTDTIVPSAVTVQASYSNALDNYYTEPGTFFVVPDSKYSLTYPTSVEPTSVISIPFSIHGVDSTGSIKGITVELENLSEYSFMTFDSVAVSGYGTSTWNVQKNFNTDVAKIVLADLGGQSGISSDGPVFDLNFTISQSRVISIPDKPIVINVEFADGDNTYYGYPGQIFMGEGRPSADICSRNATGDIETVKDGFVSTADLHCLVNDWKHTGSDVLADVFIDDNNIVDIRDLTVILSAWSLTPVIDSITPSHGVVTTQVVVVGSNFYDNYPDLVKLYLKDKNDADNIYPLTINSIAEGRIEVTIPTATPAGDYYMRILVANGEQVTTADGFTID